MRCYRLLVAVLWQLCAIVALAIPAHGATTHIAPELLAEGGGMPGETVTLAIAMRPESGWHGYWSNPGDAGLGMTLKWRLPAGSKAGEPLYPVPDTLLVAGLMNHVFKGDYALLVPLVLPSSTKPGQALPVAVEAQWLACTDQICVPERASLQTTVMVGPRGKPDRRFDAWRIRLPAPLGAQAHFTRTAAGYRLGIPLPAAMALQAPHFFASQDRLVAYAAAQRFSRKGDLLIIELDRPKLAAKQSDRLDGVLRLNSAGDGLAITALPGVVPANGKPLAPAGETAMDSLPLLLLGALVGGLLLNIMPCVFPILSLKALSLARAGDSEAHARTEGLAYTAGVVLACGALGALLLSLRAAGQEVGWAFQLQEPWVVVALLLLAAAITLNLLGAFEFAVPGFATAGSPQGAFATGLLAAFVATPCTGPFMAAAMGAALLLPVIPAMTLFLALGLGIALPFLAIAFVPALRRLLPKPGHWMTTFRRWLALPMGLTALALLWLTSRLGGLTLAAGAALVALLMLAGLVYVGRSQRAGNAVLFPALAVTIVPLLAAFALGYSARPPAHSADSGILAAKPFSEAALAEARTAGKPVFAWFTADWCLTCKVNEEVAIERPEVRKAFAKAGVVVLRGDWTRRDPAITQYLTAQGAAGVPLYVWYPAGGGAPRQLPQLLTPGSLTELAAP
jgi:DsbC/DsbD-like thiol-disulfide interchange protein/cytochrome c biogenesis protein CcdA